ncbi:hypothetical protein BT69DRAFT_1287355 [Atractiella rhizophila]|nr:hypothetical protein BT69DRAFT_1287355 [Atractiella rhizophila]
MTRSSTASTSRPFTPPPSHPTTRSASFDELRPIRSPPTSPIPHIVEEPAGLEPTITGDTRPDSNVDDDGTKRRFGKVREWMEAYPVQYELENKGSVARDHLANERTYLAWLRTSLSLASIGVAITQLFRLSSSIYTIPPSSPGTSPSPSSSSSSSIATPTPSAFVSEAQQQSEIAILSAQLAAQAAQIEALGALVSADKHTYRHLGKPIGGLFIVLGLFLLFLGTIRYFRVQYFLVNGNHFPPSRRSTFASTILIAASVVAAFASILAFR